MTFGLKSLYGIVQNRLTNYLYRFEVKEFSKILKLKHIKIYILLYIAFSISFSTFIIPLIFRLVFEESYYYIIPYAVTYSIFYFMTSPISLFNIPLKIHLGTKENFFINSLHPLLSFILILLLSRYGLNGYLLTRIILMLTINIYYLKSIKKLIT